MRIDLHTHSRASDGTQTPRPSWCARPRRPGWTCSALTDHDTTEGWAEAARTAEEVGITLVRGMEISTNHLGRGVHLLAYLPDPTYPPLATQLRKILDGRSSRVPAMLERLRALGIDVDTRTYAAPPTARRRPAARTWPTRWSRWAWCRTATRRSGSTSARAGRRTSTGTPPRWSR